MRESLGDYINELKEDFSQIYQEFKGKTNSNKVHKASNFDKQVSLLEFLPYRSFNPKYGLFENKTSLGFVIGLSHFSGIDLRTKNALRSLINNEIPAACSVQVINYASPRIGGLLNYWYAHGGGDKIYKKITEKRRDFFRQGNWRSILRNKKSLLVRDYELYMCFSLSNSITESGRAENLYKLKDLQERLSEGFKALMINAEQLNEIQLANFVQEILVPSFNSYKESNKETLDEIRDYFKSDLQIQMKKDSIRFGPLYYSVFEVVEFPEYWDLENSINYIGDFETGSSIPCPFYISYGFSLKTRGESERIADKYRMIKTQAADSKLPMFFPRMMEERNDWHYVSERINQGERLGKALMNIVLIASDEEQLMRCEAVLKDHFAKLKFKIEKISNDTLNSFLHTLPFNIGENWQILDQLKIPSKMLSGDIMNLMPVFGDAQNYADPLLLFVGRLGQIFFFDNFRTLGDANGNFNMVIPGASGCGKSVWLEEYTTSILRVGGQVIIIDDGRSFKNVCEILDGDFVDFGGGDFCINPFSLYRDQSSREDSKEYKEYFEEPFIDLIVSMLCIILNIDKNNNIDPEVGLYRAIIGNAVEEVIRKKGNSGGFSDIREELLSNQNIRTTHTEEIINKVEYILRKYSNNGRYARYFNGPATIDIVNKLTVFELSDLQHNLVLQNSTLMLVTFLVYAKTQSRRQRTVLIIDEFWRLGVHPALKGPIEGFARRGRKYNLSLCCATQSISDFSKESSEAGSAALAQSDWRIILSVDGKDKEMLKSELGMSDAEIEIAKNLSGLKGSYSEFMIRHKNNSWVIGRLILDPFSAKLYSTKAEDVARIMEMRKSDIQVEEAIERLLEEN